MRFGDRIGSRSWKTARNNCLKYWKFLASQGFKVKDRFYTLFAGDVFHDGKLSLDPNIPERKVCLRIKNVAVVDRLWKTSRTDMGLSRIATDKACTTSVVCINVDSFFVRIPKKAIGSLKYYSSEIGRDHHGKHRLDISFCTENSAMGKINIVCDSVKVEDIRPKLAKLMRTRTLPKVTWVCRSAKYYANHPADIWKFSGQSRE
jgi:hypothetical protein